MEPLKRLTQKGVEFFWGKVEDKAFTKVKQLVNQAPVLAYYIPHKGLAIRCDASSWGLGDALKQEEQPLANASRALTDPETRYATIEKRNAGCSFRIGEMASVRFWSSCYCQNKPKVT